MLAAYILWRNFPMLSSKIKGALFVVTSTLFYNNDGSLSFLKCALFAGSAYYFIFLNPLMFYGILELSIIFFAFYVLAKVVMAAFNGGLEVYGQQKSA